MKRIKLKESDIQRIVKRVLNEQDVDAGEKGVVTKKQIEKVWEKKEGWKKIAGYMPLSQYPYNEFYYFQNVGKTQANADSLAVDNVNANGYGKSLLSPKQHIKYFKVISNGNIQVRILISKKD